MTSSSSHLRHGQNAGLVTNRRQLLQQATACAAAGLLSPAPRAQPGAPIMLGHTYPASGIFAETASEMKAAIDAAVLVANNSGGIAGRPLKLLSLDDGYEPARSVANAERLRSESSIIALVAPIGAPNLAALMPWAERTRIPLVGARSGADPQRRYHRQVFFNIASFGDEVRHVARHLATIGIQRVGLAAMDNPTGAAIAQQLAQAAAQHGLTLVASERFAPDGSSADAAAQRLHQARPNAVMVAGGGQGALVLVQQLLDAGMPALSLYALSLLQPQHLYGKLGERSNGIVFTQVMPRLDDARLPLAARYRQALQAATTAQAAVSGKPPVPVQPTPFGLEGFVSMQVLLHALAHAGPTIDANTLTAALERIGTLDLGGLRLQYDGSSHHGTHYVDLGILSRGRVTR